MCRCPRARCRIYILGGMLLSLLLLLAIHASIQYNFSSYETYITQIYEQDPEPSQDQRFAILKRYNDRLTDPKVITRHTSTYDIKFASSLSLFTCITMQLTPPTPICIYNMTEDKFISHDLLTTGIWEGHVLYDFIDVLRRDADVGVIDIGANIGVYSLVAAQMGHQVVSVEPLLDNIARLGAAARKAGTQDRITVLHNAVADVRTTAQIIENYENKGDTRIVLGYHGCAGQCPQAVKTIWLDDLLEVVTFKKAIIKIDCQGYEHRAFKHAADLLDAIQVEYIYMEWITMKSYYSSANQVDTHLVQDMMSQFLHRRYRPYSLDAHGARPLDPLDWHSWPSDVVWRSLPTHKEKTWLRRNHYLHWPAVMG